MIDVVRDVDQLIKEDKEKKLIDEANKEKEEEYTKGYKVGKAEMLAQIQQLVAEHFKRYKEVTE